MTLVRPLRLLSLGAGPLFLPRLRIAADLARLGLLAGTADLALRMLFKGDSDSMGIQNKVDNLVPLHRVQVLRNPLAVGKI
jgi:hypothetical protein